ncbi:P-loop containing nucleoside triphosphate hydrolase, partial [Ostreococcus tauri]
TSETARGVLGALGITGSAAVDRTIGSLSGGEKARVALAAFVLRPVNVLLLDEASNHLDGTAIEALCEGLRGWEGAVCAITHNASFAVALNPTVVVRVEHGSATSAIHVPGKIDIYGSDVGASATVDNSLRRIQEKVKTQLRLHESLRQLQGMALMITGA